MATKSYFVSLIILILTIVISCNGRLYLKDDKEKTFSGRLSDSNYILLQKYLTQIKSAPLKDTIVIKYDYNYETCWSGLDEANEAEIKFFVNVNQDKVTKALANRKNVSFYGFREPGNSLNKVKKWDNTIIIDSSKHILNLLFKERSRCGSSIIIMPDKQFIYTHSDAHSEVLDYTEDQLKALLQKK